MTQLKPSPADSRFSRPGEMNFTVLLTGEETSGFFSVVEFRLGPSTLGAPDHTHSREDVFLWGIEGEIMVQVDGRAAPLQPFTWLKLPRGTPHAIWNGGVEAARYLELISPAGSERFFTELAEALASGERLDYETVCALEQKYGLKFDLNSILAITEQHEIKIDERFGSIGW